MSLKKILNSREALTHAKLKETCERYGAAVYPKVRLADILPIENSGIENDLYRYALQAHFDFVVTNVSHDPLFAVEYDGPVHETDKQITRDNKKHKICKIFDFPLLRINARYLDRNYRGFDLLSWFVEVWFTREIFFNAYKAGIIPEDEMFDPSLIFELPGRKGTFPLWLSKDALNQIRKFAEAERIKYPFPTGEWIGTDNIGNFHGIIWLWIDEEKGVSAHTAMRAQNFPVVESDILREILVLLLYDVLSHVLTGKVQATPIGRIVNEIEAFTKKYEVRISVLTHVPSKAGPKAT